MDDLNKEQIYLQWLFDKNQRINQLQLQVQQLTELKAELEAEVRKLKEGS